jgi:hypothetical protein
VGLAESGKVTLCLELGGTVCRRRSWRNGMARDPDSEMGAHCANGLGLGMALQ